MAASSTARRQTPRKQAGQPAKKKSAPLRAAPVEYTGRFAQLLTEVEQPEPYQITDDVAIEPPDKSRMGHIISSQTAYVIARGQLESMMAPMTDEQGEVLRDDKGQPIYPQVSNESLAGLEKLVNKAAEEYDRALFGDAYDEIMRLSQGWTGAVWNAFYKDVQDTFLPVPDDGRCPTCGQIVDEEQAGKPHASATSSKTTGTQ